MIQLLPVVLLGWVAEAEAQQVRCVWVPLVPFCRRVRASESRNFYSGPISRHTPVWVELTPYPLPLA